MGEPSKDPDGGRPQGPTQPDVMMGEAISERRPRSGLGLEVPSYNILGVPISITSLTRASATIHGWAEDGHGRFVCIRDVHGLMQTVDDPALRLLHRKAAMVTPDGMPLVWIGLKRGLAVSRTCGADLMDQVYADSEKSGLTHYLYGGKVGIVDTLLTRFKSRYPRLRVVGVETPPFHLLDNTEVEALAARIEKTGASVVWIGLSTPKQEFLMERLAPLLSSTLVGVGAAFDFHAGAVKRAPVWMQRGGLEWFFRLITEPRRLWRRYLIMCPRFLLNLAHDFLKTRSWTTLLLRD